MLKHLLFFAFLLMSGFANAQYVPSAGLIAYYPFNGNANDQSGNGYHMTVSGATLTTNRYGQTGKAYYFDGVNDLISYIDTLPLSGNCTWSFWASIDTFQNSAFIFNGNTNSSGYGFGINSGSNPSQGAFGDKVTFFSGGINYNISIPFQSSEFFTWHHFVLTKNGNNFKLYIDNNLRDSSFSFFNLPNGKFHLGLDFSDNTNPFKGKIDDVALYNRVLTILEIDTLFKGCGPQIASGPVTTSAPSGTNTILTVNAGASANVNFQWQRNMGSGFVNLTNTPPFSGVYDDTLVISNVTAVLNNHDFRAILTNDIGCKDTSGAAKLLVTPNSIDDVADQNPLTVFPNPSKGEIRIAAHGLNPNELYQVVLKNILGQTAQQWNTSGAGLEVLRINIQAKGIYILSVSDANQKSIGRRKLLIE